jgi:hypothetical protein
MILFGEFVFDHFAALHHELYPFEFIDVFERVARVRDQTHPPGKPADEMAMCD